VVLYDTDKNDPIYYTDPGKIKTYLSHGLPVIMTKTSALYPYIQRHHAGICIQKNTHDFIQAIHHIQEKYSWYKQGVQQLCSRFYYKTYYRRKFTYLESIHE
jgi:hypothetical protein